MTLHHTSADAGEPKQPSDSEDSVREAAHDLRRETWLLRRTGVLVSAFTLLQMGLAAFLWYGVRVVAYFDVYGTPKAEVSPPMPLMIYPIVSVAIVLATILLLARFEFIRKNAEVLFLELSDELQW